MKRLSLLLGVYLAVLITGCGVSDREAYQNGYRKGFEEGYAEGNETGTRVTAFKYESQRIYWGLGLGLFIGSALVLLFTHRYIIQELRKSRQRRMVRASFKACDTNFDPDIYHRIQRIAIRKQQLRDSLNSDSGKLLELMHGSLSLRLKQMDDWVLRIAQLLQHLRNARSEVDVNEEETLQRIRELEHMLETYPGEKTKPEIEEALDAEKRMQETAAQNLDNIHRCEMKLTTLSSFLDNLVMTVENLRTVQEQDAFERFEKEVDEEIRDMQTVFDRTMSQLFSS